ncbi:glycosyltransferase family 2 protein [Fundidesulfovibrio agrisoli]|uniref:glycosyltransferase family 2 protein n=1 Tax=Fundidesulfovibrio agrisoli TaxID=2922717 RepID=UPI001FAB5EC2|nr:glycosyltransferase family 2 protein [Fundidesulfovibrio agrisoli]
MSMLDISVVIPVYNGRATVPALWERLRAVLDICAGSYEVVFVDDASPDGSWSVLEELAAIDPRCKAIRMMRNQGQHNALLCGIRAATYPVIVTMDDDLQHPPEEIPRLLEEFAKGHAVVYGACAQEQHGLLRNLASRLTKRVLQQAMGVAAAQSVSAFRVFRTELRDAFADCRNPLPNIDVMLSWGTTRFGAVQVRHEPRREGVSGYNLRKLLIHAVNMITGYTVLPLQLASLVGFVLTLAGVGLLAFVLGRYLIQGTTMQGFPFLASIICIFSGAQLFALGIIGEYFARMYLRLMDKPVYTEAQRLNFPEPPKQ